MQKHETTINNSIFKGFRHGDEKFFEIIFNRYNSKIVAFCLSFVQDKFIAENISQEAFINLWINRKKVRRYNGIASYLYTYAKGKCLNHIRNSIVKQNYINNSLKQQEIELDIKILSSFEFDNFDFMELEELYLKSLNKLPPKCKEVFIKSRFDGGKNTEIAEELNISTKAVEANITRALRHLRKHLSDYVPTILIEIMLKIM